MKLVIKKDYEEYRTYTVHEGTINSERNKDVNEDKQLTHLRRAKRDMVDILEHNLTPDSVFITLTFEDNISDYEYASECFKGFVKKLKKHTGVKIEYMRTQELQSRGAIHFHTIFFTPEVKELFNSKKVRFFNKYDKDQKGDMYKGKNGKYVILEKGLWTYGYGNLKPIHNYHCASPQAIANYFAKYIANILKGQMIDKNKKLYSPSRGIKRTQVLTIPPGVYAEEIKEEIIDTADITVYDHQITKSIHKRGTHEKKFKKYYDLIENYNKNKTITLK